MTQEALKLALEFIENSECGTADLEAHIKEALAQTQEPAAWMVYTQDGQSVYVTDNPTDIQENQRALPLYATPQRTWVGLTEDEVYRIAVTLEGEHWKKIADAIEAKLKEKNT